jgi:hypothetical protein
VDFHYLIILLFLLKLENADNLFPLNSSQEGTYWVGRRKTDIKFRGLLRLMEFPKIKSCTHICWTTSVCACLKKIMLFFFSYNTNRNWLNSFTISIQLGESCTSWRDFLFFGHHTFKNKLSELPIILKERGENELYASNF